MRKNYNLMCIYHGNCQDGFAAAWVVRKALGEENVEFVPGVYGEPPPDVTGKRVILVDFSYKYDVLMEMAYKAQHITVIDHHKTAKEDLGRITTQLLMDTNRCGMDINFDMTKSGALLTWEHYFPAVEPPKVLQHISDRDIWEFKLTHTREIVAALFSHPYDFKVMDKLMDPRGIHELVTEGTAIERKHHKDVAELVEVCRRPMEIGGYVVPVASLPYTLTSDAGHLMAEGSDGRFAACYWDTDNGRTFSLRSTDDGIDVSEIAKQYGGGGHRNAAGFKVPRTHVLAMM